MFEGTWVAFHTNKSLKVNREVNQVIKNENGNLTSIARGFEHQSKDVLLQL